MQQTQAPHLHLFMMCFLVWHVLFCFDVNVSAVISMKWHYINALCMYVYSWVGVFIYCKHNHLSLYHIRNVAFVFVASTHNISRKRGARLGLLATTNQLVKVKKSFDSWVYDLKPKCLHNFFIIIFQSVQVTNSQAQDCRLEFVSSCIHNPNCLSLNLFCRKQN